MQPPLLLLRSLSVSEQLAELTCLATFPASFQKSLSVDEQPVELIGLEASSFFAECSQYAASRP